MAEHNRLLVFPAAEFVYESPDVAVGIVKEPLVPSSKGQGLGRDRPRAE